MSEQLRRALQLLLDNTDTPPAPNCSCHLSPPCSDCVNYGGLREAIAEAQAALSSTQSDAGTTVAAPSNEGAEPVSAGPEAHIDDGMRYRWLKGYSGNGPDFNETAFDIHQTRIDPSEWDAAIDRELTPDPLIEEPQIETCLELDDNGHECCRRKGHKGEHDGIPF